MNEKLGFEKQRIIRVMGNQPVNDFGCHFRSKLERNWAAYLNMLKKVNEIESWTYEPKTFHFPDQKTGPYKYMPDFHILDNKGRIYWQELKGWLDGQTISKFRKMREFYPDEKFELVLMRIPKKGMAEKRYYKMKQRIENDKDFNVTRIIDGGAIIRQVKGII